MQKKLFLVSLAIGGLLALVGGIAGVAEANHSLFGYHWARTANPLTLKLGDDVTRTWDKYLVTASNDWRSSDVLDTAVVSGKTNPRYCNGVHGRIEVCNGKYGSNGWLGLATVWTDVDGHIVQGTVMLNDTYFNTARFNTSAWRYMVMCQEVGHTFGLDHQDEDFYNANLGTCMDYTTDAARNDGFGNNEHPNAHDYEELDLIYAHLDLTNTAVQTAVSQNHADVNSSDPATWGKEVRKSAKGKEHSSLFERDLENGEKAFTFVTWAE